MRKICLLLAISFSINLYSQKPNQNFFTDIYSLPFSDSTFQFYYLYKIPVKSLIFSKYNDTYSASVQITVEVSDSNSNFLQRHFKDRNITYSDFSLTSDPNTYIEGLITFPYENKTIAVTSTFFDGNSQKEIFSKEQIYPKVKNDGVEFLSPIIVNDKYLKCGEDDFQVLTNFGSYIPFDNNSYNILIPTTDNNLEMLFVKIISQKDTLFAGQIERKRLERLKFAECEGRIIILSDSVSNLISNFYLPGITGKFKEGPVEIILSRSENFLVKKTFKPIVKWLNKPKSLNDPESAIKLLKFIIREDSVKKILKSGDDYDSLLHKFWKKIDPSPDTEFNELMAEYYERIDYSIKNFSTITGLSGLETNRAKIYILNGKPTLVERGSNGEGKITETWTYSNLQKKFVFVDEKGTGEFILKNSL